MAEIVIGIGTSHSPQLSIRAKDWDHLLKKDRDRSAAWITQACCKGEARIGCGADAGEISRAR